MLIGILALSGVPYDITFFTADVQSAGTDSKLHFKVYGSEGSTPDILLDKDADRFERACVDVLRFDLEDIGVLKKLRVMSDGKGSRPSWFLDKVINRLFVVESLMNETSDLRSRFS